jgi:hypothetical protein
MPKVVMMNSEPNVIYPFADPDVKYTMMDNFLFDHIMPLVKPNAWKILCLIIRKTRGWHKTSDQISFSQIKAGTGISSDETVNNALKQLVGNGYILTKKGGQWDATAYAINTNYSTTIIEVEGEPTTEIEAEPTTEIEVASTTKIVDTKETIKISKDKQTSANADFSRPVSLLSEKEVKELKLPLATWKQYLEDEKSERARKGVIDFLEKKIATGGLLPDTPAAQLLFDKLAVEAEAMGRRPPQKFPTLAVKEKFDIAASSLNGTLESAINKALEAGITSIPKIVNYISSPKWRDNDGPQTRKRKVVSQAPRTQSQFAPAAGSGQSPETARRLREAFAPKV